MVSPTRPEPLSATTKRPAPQLEPARVRRVLVKALRRPGVSLRGPTYRWASVELFSIARPRQATGEEGNVANFARQRRRVPPTLGNQGQAGAPLARPCQNLLRIDFLRTCNLGPRRADSTSEANHSHPEPPAPGSRSKNESRALLFLTGAAAESAKRESRRRRSLTRRSSRVAEHAKRATGGSGGGSKRPHPCRGRIA